MVTLSLKIADFHNKPLLGRCLTLGKNKFDLIFNVIQANYLNIQFFMLGKKDEILQQVNHIKVKMWNVTKHDFSNLTDKR